MSNDCMLTTFDNPFDPFDQFTSWLLFDKEKGHNTCEYLARIANLTICHKKKLISKLKERLIRLSNTI